MYYVSIIIDSNRIRVHECLWWIAYLNYNVNKNEYIFGYYNQK